MDNAKTKYLETLFLENYTAMETYAARFFHNSDLAQDVVQETFLIAQHKIDHLMQSPSPRGWLFNTLKNVIGNTYKQQKKLSAMVPLQDCDKTSDLDIAVETQYGGLISSEDLRLLIRVYCEGWPYSDIANELGVTLSACKKRIQRAKLRLKKAIEHTENTT